MLLAGCIAIDHNATLLLKLLLLLPQFGFTSIDRRERRHALRVLQLQHLLSLFRA